MDACTMHRYHRGGSRHTSLVLVGFESRGLVSSVCLHLKSVTLVDVAGIFWSGYQNQNQGPGNSSLPGNGRSVIELTLRRRHMWVEVKIDDLEVHHYYHHAMYQVLGFY